MLFFIADQLPVFCVGDTVYDELYVNEFDYDNRKSTTKSKLIMIGTNPNGRY